MKKLLANPGVKYLLTFGIVALALFSVLATPWADKAFTQPFTRMLVDLSAALIAPFDSRVVAEGDILRFTDGRGAVQVLAGCNAVEVCALLVAAILAFPGRLRDGLIGAAVGVLALQVVNLGRIISLLYLSRGSEHLFDFFHAYVWDAMIGLEGLLIFFFWTRWQERQGLKAAASRAAPDGTAS
ncbi:MAG: exosortase H [Caulobacterales bacterium]|nr:exosortase H [Caulobacterales bacterium]